MRLLLDECVPRKFRDSLRGHDCRTVPEEGMAGKKNGELLLLAEQAGFEVFLNSIVAWSTNKTCSEGSSLLS